MILRWRDVCLAIAILFYVVAALVFEGKLDDLELAGETLLAIGLAVFACAFFSEVAS